MERTSRANVGAGIVIVVCLVLTAIAGRHVYDQRQGSDLSSPPVVHNSLSPALTAPSETIRPGHRHKTEIPKVQPAPPTQLAIPSIGVNAYVGKVAAAGKTASNPQGYLQPPERTVADLMRAYWWSEQQAPGSHVSKTTFIIGHTCHTEGCPAVFNRLQTVKIGALVSVATRQGVLTYRIFRTREYPASAVRHSSKVYDYNEPNWLVLATCKLKANGGVQTDRFVAWARLVSARRG